MKSNSSTFPRIGEIKHLFAFAAMSAMLMFPAMASGQSNSYRRTISSTRYEIVTPKSDGTKNVKRYDRCSMCAMYQDLPLYARYNIQPGYQLCSVCLGSGMSGSMPCVSCHGRLVTKCFYCTDGYELIANYTDDQANYIDQMEKCKNKYKRFKAGDKLPKSNYIVKKNIFHDNGANGFSFDIFCTDGTLLTIRHTKCFFCQGSGKCTNPYCTDGYTSTGYPIHRAPCVICSGSRRCKRCHGTGLDFMTSNTAASQAGMSTVSSGGSYSTGSTSSSRSTSSSNSRGYRYVRCSACNGGGYELAHYSTCADVMGKYKHNTSGRCSYCGDYGEHYHYRCSKCQCAGKIKVYD